VGRASKTRTVPGRASRSSDEDLLRRVPYFRSLPPAELSRLAAACASRRLRAGETLFEEDAPCRGLHVVAEGSVEIGRISSNGRAQILHTEGPGAALGEGPLFDRGGYIASAVARTAARVLFVPRAYLLGLCRRRPEVSLSMLAALARRLRGFAQIASDLAFRPVDERVARYLHAECAGRRGAELRLPFTQGELAARLGTVREPVARALARLERAGVIARRRSGIAIRDPERLAELALRRSRASGPSGSPAS